MNWMRWGGLPSVLLLSVLASPTHAQDPVSAASLQTEAIRLYRAKQYGQALPLYRQLVHLSPENPDILEDLAWTLYYAEHYQEAASVASRLTVSRSEDAQVWALMGRCQYHLGYREEAVAALQKSLSLDPDQPPVRLDLARVEMALRNYADAIVILKDLRDHHPDIVESLPELARAQGFTGRFGESARTWVSAVAAFPDNVDYQFQQARALYFAGKRARAISKMRALLKASPHHRATVDFLVDTALAQNDWRQAAAIWEDELTDPTPVNNPRLLRLAALYQDHDDFDRCIATIDRLLEGNPRDGQALLFQGDCLRSRGSLDEAEDRYKRVLKDNPWSFRSLKSLADVEFSRSHYDAALSFIRQARAMDPTDPYMLFLEANYLYARGDKADSTRMIQQWLVSNSGPSLPVLLYHGLTPYPGDPLLAYPIHTLLSNFDDQMHALKTAGFHPITAEEAQRWLEGKEKLPPRPILITFDDARLDSFRYADPVLNKYGLKATMAVALANVSRNLPGFATWGQMQGYQRTGRWEMQAHGNLGHSKIPTDEEGHVALYMPNKQWLEDENRLETTSEWETRITRDMQETTDALIAHMGHAPVAFAFPEGDFGQDNINNFMDAPPLILKHSRALYGSLYHQDGYGFNTVTRDPSFLCRFEVNPQWLGRQLIRHLTDRDPVVIAKRTLLRQATWDGRTHEAKVLLGDLQRAGVSPAALLADAARIRASVGDRVGAWDLANRALSFDPGDRENQALVQSLREEKAWTWTPVLEDFRDNHGRRNWMFRQQIENRASGRFHWLLNQFHGFFSEGGVPNVTDDGGGAGFSRPVGLYHTVSAEADGHGLSRPGESTLSVEGHMVSRWTDFLDTDIHLARAPYPTARALDAHVAEQSLELKSAWAWQDLWKFATEGRVAEISDHNQRYGGYLEVSRLLGSAINGLRAIYRFTADQTDQVSPNYYSPQQLQLHQLGVDYALAIGDGFKCELRYLPGYGDEKGARDSFIQVGDADFVISLGKTFSVRPSVSFTSTPSYNSASYVLALVSSF